MADPVYVKNQGVFSTKAQNGLAPITDPVILRDLYSGKTPYTDMSGTAGYSTAPAVGSPSPTPQGNQPQTPVVPQDTASLFNQGIVQLLHDAKNRTQAVNAQIGAQQNALTNQSLNLSNPLNTTPYQQYFQGLNAGQTIGGMQGTQEAFQPGITSLNTQMQLNNQALQNDISLYKETAQPYAVPYMGSVYNPLSNTFSGGMSGDTTQLIPNAIRNQQLTPEMIQRYGAPYILQVLQGDPGFNFITNQASKSAQVAGAVSGAQWRNVPGTSGFTQTQSPGGQQGGAGNMPPDQINALQQELVSKGYMTPAQVATGPGIFGPQTQRAYAAYQAANGGQSMAGYSSGGVIQPGGTGAMTSTNPINMLSPAAKSLLQTGDFINPYDHNAQLAEVYKLFPNFNPAIAKANTKAIGEQVTNQADVYRAIDAADTNFNMAVDTFKKTKVNNMESPLANAVANALGQHYIGNDDIIRFQSAISTLQTEYASVLGRGGEVTDSVRKSAANVISGNYSMKDLTSLHDYIDKEGKNVINSYTKTIDALSSGGIGTNIQQSPLSPFVGNTETTTANIQNLRLQYKY